MSKPHPDVHQFFSRHGALSKWHPNYEYRPGQLAMAEAVESALADRKHLIVEAGTGTGKTLAYLVPAILSGKAHRNLHWNEEPAGAALFQGHPIPAAAFSAAAARLLHERAAITTPAGRKSTMPTAKRCSPALKKSPISRSSRTGKRLPNSATARKSRSCRNPVHAWAKVDARSDLCTGQKCKQFERCFLTLMHQRAHSSDIIIVNHHLFFADLALKQVLEEGDVEGGILPEYHAVVFDEAHEIEDVAGQYFGVSVSNYRFQELRRDISAVARAKQFGSPELDRILDRFEELANYLFTLIPAPEGRAAFTGRAEFLERHEEVYRDLHSALELIGSHLKVLKNPPVDVIPLQRRAVELGIALRFVLESDDQSYVYWAERRGRGFFMQATPIDVAPLLANRLFDSIDTVVLTSATLAVAGGFDFVKGRLGIQQARTLVVPGHFDYQKQALLYVPQHLPDPRSAAFPKEAAIEVTRLLRASQGRAFVLFTSYQQMRLMYDRVSLDVDFPTLMQGTGPRSALLEEFRATPNCVLFATSSFWQGVDVPGDQLSCVIIDRLPFAVPSDPIVEARVRKLREQGGNPFYDYQVPQAAIALKQGFGRLIRSRSDRGVLVLLDNRVTKQRYGQVFFDSLPDYGFTTKITDVENFFNV